MSGNRVNQDFEVESSGMDDSRLNHRVGSVVCAVFVAITFFPVWFFAVLAAFSLKPRLLFLAGQQQDHEIALQAFGRVLTIVCVKWYCRGGSGGVANVLDPRQELLDEKDSTCTIRAFIRHCRSKLLARGPAAFESVPIVAFPTHFTFSHRGA